MRAVTTVVLVGLMVRGAAAKKFLARNASAPEGCPAPAPPGGAFVD